MRRLGDGLRKRGGSICIISGRWWMGIDSCIAVSSFCNAQMASVPVLLNIIFSMLLCCNFVPMWNKCGNQDLLTRCELSVDNRPVTFWLPELLQYVDGLSSIMCAFDAQCKKCVQESVVKGMWDRWVMDYVKYGSFCIVWSVEWQPTGCISVLELLQCANGLLSSVFMFFFLDSRILWVLANV